ncbi:hypothetical protein GOBAR_DD24293 [Gossypium barbadense]|nr:hypothetical protein GOBAR_DD24293 [Gossypium barbadense]
MSMACPCRIPVQHCFKSLESENIPPLDQLQVSLSMPTTFERGANNARAPPREVATLRGGEVITPRMIYINDVWLMTSRSGKWVTSIPPREMGRQGHKNGLNFGL